MKIKPGNLCRITENWTCYNLIGNYLCDVNTVDIFMFLNFKIEEYPYRDRDLKFLKNDNYYTLTILLKDKICKLYYTGHSNIFNETIKLIDNSSDENKF